MARSKMAAELASTSASPLAEALKAGLSQEDREMISGLLAGAYKSDIDAFEAEIEDLEARIKTALERARAADAPASVLRDLTLQLGRVCGRERFEKAKERQAGKQSAKA